ncbi:Dyp-type peroxidase [Brevibacterium album]|uniref:Dyp-type peroxidase n=1 Tax=Brevibacterium album TaxID=417948 RepID=UPI000420ED91|nr:Dyp-type peroxidase [Brevibacterium album]
MVVQKIVTPPPPASLFLVLTLRPGGEGRVREVLTGIPGLTRSVGFRASEAHLVTVTGIGAAAWDRLTSAPRPEGLHPFPALVGAVHSAPSTPGDLLLHLRADRLDLCFEFARLALDALGDAVEVEDEVHGFRYFEVRDLLGFVDGTENPEDEDAEVAVRIPESEDPAQAAYAGGSFVHVQKYLHDLHAWGELSTEEQERVIGRTKLDDVELDDEVKPANSHVALNDLDDRPDGTPREIFRHNMPFGTLGEDEFGTYFIGYSGDPADTEEMLENMFIGKPPGNHDRILDFSTAVTGAMFFVPPTALLEAFTDLPPAAAAALGPAPEAAPEPASAASPAGPSAPAADEAPAAPRPVSPSLPAEAGAGSLGIGSLRTTARTPS